MSKLKIIESEQGREMALADNATAKANITFDEVIIDEVCTELDIDIKDWGVSFDVGDIEIENKESENNYSKVWNNTVPKIISESLKK